MTNKGNNSTDDGQVEQSRASLAGWLPFLLVAAVLIAIVVQQVSSQRGAEARKASEVQVRLDEKQDLREMHDDMVAEEARLREEVRDSNLALGLDADYPSFRFPLYEGMEVLETRKEEAQSTLGETMDMWFVKGQVDAELDAIQQFYRDRLQEEGMRQTQYISIPGGYAFNYADEWYDTRFAIEQQSTDPLPRVEITIYRVRDDSVQIGD